MAKERTSANYTSVYLDDDSRAKLDAMAERSDQSRSQVVRGLIQLADETNRVQISEHVAAMADLLQLR